MTQYKKTTMAIFAFAFGALSVNAAPQHNFYSLEAGLGGNLPNHFKGDNRNNQNNAPDYQNKRRISPIVSVRVNRKILQNWELGISAYKLFNGRAKSIYVASGSVQSQIMGIEDKYRSFSLFVSSKYQPKIFEHCKMIPYLAAGVGASWNTVTNTVHRLKTSNPNPLAIGNRKTIMRFAYQVGLGINYQHNTRVSYISELMFQNLGKLADGPQINAQGVISKTNHLKYKYRHFMITAGIKYSF